MVLLKLGFYILNPDRKHSIQKMITIKFRIKKRIFGSILKLEMKNEVKVVPSDRTKYEVQNWTNFLFLFCILYSVRYVCSGGTKLKFFKNAVLSHPAVLSCVVGSHITNYKIRCFSNCEHCKDIYQ